MPAIHFVERLGNYHCVDSISNEWESGHWVVAEDTAQRLVNGMGQIYLHDAQNEPSRFGGDILSFRVHRGGNLDGRLIFRFKPTPQCKNVRTNRNGWGNEKKIVW
ncbi:MAG: hypothetical protein ACOYOS_00330 [Syntrophales bacterium]